MRVLSGFQNMCMTLESEVTAGLESEGINIIWFTEYMYGL